MIKLTINAFAMLACMAAAAGDAAEQAGYPNRPIRILLPFAAGGTVDIMARPIAAKLHEQLGVHGNQQTE